MAFHYLKNLTKKFNFISLSIIIIIIIFSLSYHSCQSNSNQEANDELGLTPAEIIELRGFRARNYYVTTKDGYILNLVRATNKLFNNGESGLKTKQVVLFIHGILTNSKCFLINSVDAHPENYGNNCSMSADKLISKFGRNPNAKTLFFLLLNCGYEVWLWNRRGTQYSLGHTDPAKQAYLNNNNPSTINPNITIPSNNNNNNNSTIGKIGNILTQNPLAGLVKDYVNLFSNPQFLINQINPLYWNYTIDTEAANDFTPVIDYILNITSRDKLTIVGHSLGGSLPLFALYIDPSINDKLNQIISWAPGVNQGALPASLRPPLEQIAPLFENPFKIYSGPVTPTIFNPFISALAAFLCGTEFTANTLCAAANSFIFGDGGDQQTILPGFLTAAPDSVGSHQLAQLIDDLDDNRTHFYDNLFREQNVKAYGLPEPPQYDLSKLTFRNFYILYGRTDGFVQYQSVQQLIGDLTVPAKTRFFNDPGLLWNHISFFIHKNVSILLNLPCLEFLESYTD